MQISIDSFIAVIITGFGILFSLLIGIQLLARRQGVKQTNVFLGLLLVLYSLTLMDSLMAMTGLYSTYQQLYFLPLVFTLSVGPLFYFFVKSRIEPNHRLQFNDLWHFALPLAQFLFYCAIGFRSAEYKSWVWREVISPYIQYIETILVITLNTVYILAALRLLNQNTPELLWKHPVRKWLRRFAVHLLILLSIYGLYEVADWILWNSFEFNLYNHAWLDFPLKMTVAIISFVIGYNAYVYQNQAVVTPTQFREKTDDNLSKKIHQLMDEDKVYQDPDMNLDTFAKMAGEHRNVISQHLSARGDAFRSLLNRKRVDCFIDMISQGKHKQFSLLGLALEAGFNSKASFNRVFKLQMGQTPSQFVKSYRDKEAQRAV